MKLFNTNSLFIFPPHLINIGELVPRVDVSPFLQQPRHGVGAAVDGGGVQRRPAVDVAAVDVHTGSGEALGSDGIHYAFII